MPKLTPSQTVGPFFHFSLTTKAASVTDLAGEAAQGEHITIEGAIIDGEGAPLPDAMVEIWQANTAGRYASSADPQDKPIDPAFSGFGRCETDAGGRFRFRTIKPGAVPGRGNALQAPHINVSIFARGLLRQLVTRIYFDGEVLNDTDSVLALVPEERRGTLLAKRRDGPNGPVYRLDIKLQGEDETVFFDC